MTSPASRPVDRQVAERIMNWRWIKTPALREPVFMPKEQYESFIAEFQKEISVTDRNLPDRVPHYSTSIADAFLVVERMRERKYGWEITTAHGGWQVIVTDNGGVVGLEKSDVLPAAICTAALAAVGGRG